MSNDESGLYLASLIAGNVGTPGAPILHLRLAVDAPTGTVSGLARQTQAVAPPNHEITAKANGELSNFGQPAGQKLLSLRGEAVVSLPPPAIGSYGVPFVAHFLVDSELTGSGSWSFGAQAVTDAPIKSNGA